MQAVPNGPLPPGAGRREARAFVVGHPVAHSRSPTVHRHWLRTLGIEGAYQREDVAPDRLAAFIGGLRRAGYVGGNVTVPHKVAVMELLDRVDAQARAIGAVNTIWTEDGALVGGNTDAAGFLANLDERAPGWDRGRAVVLGAGGAARAVVHALRTRGMATTVVNRTRATAEALAGGMVEARGWDRLAVCLPGAGLVVNTTSLGMAGQAPLEVDLSPLPAEAVVHDIVYAPVRTALLRQAEALGLRTVDGVGMLLHQARLGFVRWFGGAPEVTAELRTLVVADIAQ